MAVDPLTGTKLHSFSSDGISSLTCPVPDTDGRALYIARTGECPGVCATDYLILCRIRGNRLTIHVHYKSRDSEQVFEIFTYFQLFNNWILIHMQVHNHGFSRIEPRQVHAGILGV